MSDNPMQNFEQQLSQLEQIVNAMEQGTLSLEESLKQYEVGIKLIRQCQASLAHAEQKIQILSQNQQGEEELSSFQSEES